MSTLNYIRNEKAELTLQRPEVKNQAIEAIKSVKLLKSELETMERDYDLMCQNK
jgi:hypothetical protein